MKFIISKYIFVNFVLEIFEQIIKEKYHKLPFLILEKHATCIDLKNENLWYISNYEICVIYDFQNMYQESD